jgi:hypothetical protein
MKKRASDVDLAEQIKWWDAVDVLCTSYNVEPMIELARECRHPDAEWLTSLLPAGAPVGRSRLQQVLIEHGDDARAMYLTWVLGDHKTELLRRAAEKGYAPAQGRMFVTREVREKRVEWAQKAHAQGDRFGTFALGCFIHCDGSCSTEDGAKAIELFREAAELGCLQAQHVYGSRAFGELDWERYFWLARAAARGQGTSAFRSTVVRFLLPLFESGQLGRILHTVAPRIREGLNTAEQRVFGEWAPEDEIVPMQRVVVLHDAMLSRARNAISCWSAVARRIGIAKDVRVLIAKMAWEQAWKWGENSAAETI